MKIAQNITELIGNTPLVELKTMWDSDTTGVRILVKLEGANPGGSVKDRPAYYMLKKAITSGELTKNKIILYENVENNLCSFPTPNTDSNTG